MRDPLGCETDLVVNLLDAVAGRKPVHQAALDACGLLAYVNSPQGAKLPDGMPDWPAVRASNGHPAPFGIQYIQIGNESWVSKYRNAVHAKRPGKSDVELAVHFHECLSEYIRVIRAIDPKIQIIIDLHLPFGASPQVYADPFILNNVSLMAYHIYQMGSCTAIQANDKNFQASQFSFEDIWTYWTMTPTLSGSGLADYSPRDEVGLKTKLRLACTEWNWVRWGYDKMDPKPPFRITLPAALGVARHLHGMVRAGDRLALTTQSILLGSTWNFAALVFDPALSTPPHISAQGQISEFYHHTMGQELLRLDFTKGLETLSVHIPDSTETMAAGAALDPLATRDTHRILLHLVNRYRDASVDVTVRFDGFGRLPRKARLQTLSLDPQAEPGGGRDPLEIATATVSLADNQASLHLARAGVYFLEVQLP